MKLENIEWDHEADNIALAFGISKEQYEKISKYIEENMKIHRNASEIVRLVTEVADFKPDEMVFAIYLIGFLSGRVEASLEFGKTFPTKKRMLGVAG